MEKGCTPNMHHDMLYSCYGQVTDRAQIFLSCHGERKTWSVTHTHTHKMNPLLTPLLTLRGRAGQAWGEGLQRSNLGRISRPSSPKTAPGVSSILHPTGERFSLYISGETKKLQNFSELDILLLSSACNNPSFFREGKCITTSLMTLVSMFRKRSLGCPLLLFYSGPDALGRGVGKSKDLCDSAQALPNLRHYS